MIKEALATCWKMLGKFTGSMSPSNSTWKYRMHLARTGLLIKKDVVLGLAQ
jgi:hypothetical protein